MSEIDMEYTISEMGVGWEEIKKRGSEHYKTGGIEPIDLIKDLGILRGFAIGSIIKYASRNSRSRKISKIDMDKIIHYAEMLKWIKG